MFMQAKFDPNVSFKVVGDTVTMKLEDAVKTMVVKTKVLELNESHCDNVIQYVNDSRKNELKSDEQAQKYRVWVGGYLIEGLKEGILQPVISDITKRRLEYEEYLRLKEKFEN